MPVGREERFAALRPRVVELFGDDPDTTRLVEQVLTLLEFAWHDCYGEPSPPEAVMWNVLTCSEGTLEALIGAAHLAVVDWRDLAVWASAFE